MSEISPAASRRIYLFATLFGVYVFALTAAYWLPSSLRRIGFEQFAVFRTSIIAEACILGLFLTTLPAWLRVRSPWAIVLFLEIPCLLTSTGYLETLAAIAAVVLVPQAVIMLPVAILRRIGNWRLGHAEDDEGKPVRPIQFGIGELLLWTAGVACVLGAARLAPPSATLQTESIALMAFVCALFAVQAVAAWPFIVAVLWPRHWIAIPVGIAYLACLTALQTYAAPRLFGPPVYNPRLVAEMAWANAAFGAWMLVNLFIFRLFGFRLQRHT